MIMPSIFVGHGSPMNAIEENAFTLKWREIGKKFPNPKGIIAISAHWYTSETRTSDLKEPVLIYDMYGFPEDLYALKYPVKGLPEIAEEIEKRLGSVLIDNQWGIDHGTWSVLCHMYPKANIPVIQLSLDYKLKPQEHYELAKKLRTFREEGYLILGSGNIVHNLALVNWHMDEGYPWALEFDGYVKKNILERSYDPVIHYELAGESHKKAFYTLEHYLPILYVLGTSYEEDEIEVFNDTCLMGAMSMTGYIFNRSK